MDVGRAVDRRDRHLVYVGTDARLRGRVVTILAAHDAAHIHVRRADTGAALAESLYGRDAREVLDVVVDIGDVQLLELVGAQSLDADRHVLQVLRALLRRDDDLLETTGLGRTRLGGLGLLRIGGRQGGEHRGRQRQAD